MSWLFHAHRWKEIARTYAAPVALGRIQTALWPEDMLLLIQQRINAARGMTTILWECEDPLCKKTRKEEMFGKSIEPEKTP